LLQRHQHRTAAVSYIYSHTAGERGITFDDEGFQPEIVLIHVIYIRKCPYENVSTGYKFLKMKHTTFLVKHCLLGPGLRQTWLWSTCRL